MAHPFENIEAPRDAHIPPLEEIVEKVVQRVIKEILAAEPQPVKQRPRFQASHETERETIDWEIATDDLRGQGYEPVYVETSTLSGFLTVKGLRLLADDVEAHNARIAAFNRDGEVCGFCKGLGTTPPTADEIAMGAPNVNNFHRCPVCK